MSDNAKNWLIGGLIVISVSLFFLWIRASHLSNDSNTEASTSKVESKADTLPLSEDNSSAQPEAVEEQKGSCIDVTSYDHNWNNDMLCTRPDGTKFYTDYAGARSYEAGL